VTVERAQTPQAKPEIFVLDTDPSMRIYLPKNVWIAKRID